MSERCVVLSDLHLGDPYGCDLLRYRWAQDKLWPLLDGCDQLILLGDTFELALQNLAASLAAARPWLQELNRRYPGMRLMMIPGNHDHHFVAQATDERRERAALQLPDESHFQVAPAERVLSTLCPDLVISSAYPVHRIGDCVLHHGHYVTTHLDSLGSRALDRLQWKILGQPRRLENLQAADYEALISPIYEFCYQVAQLPQGTDAQRDIERQLRRIAGVLHFPGHVGNQVQRVSQRAMGWVSQRRGNPRPVPDPAALEMAVSEATRQQSVEAMAQVARNLELLHDCRHIVFGHTHRPFTGRDTDLCPGVLFHNCGSWFYDYREAGRLDYWECFRPGTALELVGGQITMHQLLEQEDITNHFRASTNMTDPGHARSARPFFVDP